MSSRLRPGLFVICCLPAFAQLYSAALRAKFGPPLNREIFHMPAEFDLTVDYGAGGQVCRMEVPALMPTSETISSGPVMKQRMYAFLAELVPPSMRGLEKQSLVETMGAASLLSVDYEHVAIVEAYSTNQPFDRSGRITVMFKRADCEKN